MDPIECFETINIDVLKTSTPNMTEIKKAYRLAVKATHPDHNPGIDKSLFIKVQTAYENISKRPIILFKRAKKMAESEQAVEYYNSEVLVLRNPYKNPFRKNSQSYWSFNWCILNDMSSYKGEGWNFCTKDFMKKKSVRMNTIYELVRRGEAYWEVRKVRKQK